jgi:hypothetical protein
MQINPHCLKNEHVSYPQDAEWLIWWADYCGIHFDELDDFGQLMAGRHPRDVIDVIVRIKERRPDWDPCDLSGHAYDLRRSSETRLQQIRASAPAGGRIAELRRIGRKVSASRTRTASPPQSP